MITFLRILIGLPLHSAFDIAGLQSFAGLELGARLGELAHVPEGAGKDVMGMGEIRPLGKDLARRARRLFVAFGGEMRARHGGIINVQARIPRIDLNRLVETLDRLVVTVDRVKRGTQNGERARITRIERSASMTAAS